MRATSETLGKATYLAPKSDWTWLQSIQKKLHKRSFENPDYHFRELWGFITDPRNLRMALSRVSRNTGRRSAGVDGVTVRQILHCGVEPFVEQIREELRLRKFKPSPVRRVNIPKAGQPGKFRPLGIPTVKDRVVQAATKQILEPIFEADFYPCSYGFRPGKSAHGALEQLRLLLRPAIVRGQQGQPRRLPYQWAIEGDIKGCFDHISHHGLMNRIRRRISDLKVNRLILAFLKAGVMSDKQLKRTDRGTPQGGILSPLLANIALGVIEERYERYVWPRHTPKPLSQKQAILTRAMSARCRDRLQKPVFYPVRYCDDFIILVSVPPTVNQDVHGQRIANQEKQALAEFLWETMRLELSEAKTLVTPVTKPLRFLGHHVRVRFEPCSSRMKSATLIPKERSQRLRETIKRIFGRRTLGCTLKGRLELLNRLLRGWGNFYRFAQGAKSVFSTLDDYVWHTILRWLWKKHSPTSMKRLRARYAYRIPGRRSWKWQDDDVQVFELARLEVTHFRHGWMKTPNFVCVDGEPGA